MFLDNEIIRYVLMVLTGLLSLLFFARVLFDWRKDLLVGSKDEEFDDFPAQGSLESVEAPASYQNGILSLADNEQDGYSDDRVEYSERVNNVFESGQDDLTKIEGIGPKTEEILNAAGIFSYAKLSEIKPIRLKALLDRAGSTFRLHDPSSWPMQAELAAQGDWKKLIHLQDRLSAKRAKKPHRSSFKKKRVAPKRTIDGVTSSIGGTAHHAKKKTKATAKRTVPKRDLIQ